MNMRIAAFGGFLALVLVGCAGLPSVHDPSGVDISVTGLSDRQVFVYYGQGGPFEPDPYIANSALFAPEKHQFIVLRIEIASLQKTTITLNSATARDENGAVVARLYSKREFLALLKSESVDDQQLSAFNLKVEQTYIPDRGIEMTPGKRTYVAVLMGKPPLPHSLTVTARIDPGIGTPRTLLIDWHD
jgi:hypothetical protein